MSEENEVSVKRTAIISQKIVTHDFVDSGDGCCAFGIAKTTCGYPLRHVIHGFRALPADWHEDSSLETWFPLTAEEMKRDKDQIATLSDLCQQQHEALRGISDSMQVLPWEKRSPREDAYIKVAQSTFAAYAALFPKTGGAK